jgi:hypothetical protein
LLEELQEDAEREAVEQLVFAHGENISELRSAAARLFESEFDAAELSANFGVVHVDTFESCQAGAGFLGATFSHEPSRTLWNREHGRHGNQ